MAREGLFDDTGYHDFDECSHWEECNKEAYNQGRDDMAEETYLNLITEIDLLNASDMSEVNLYKFACRIKEIAEGLKWQNNDRK
ncbi:MAG: hypothetical protein MJ197_10065 [Bacteroidales bacterium]|nr:hypothetical protein [Bacteroidales bacterium]